MCYDKITARDRDSGEGGRVQCQLSEEGAEKQFLFREIESEGADSVSYELLTQAQLDRETRENIRLTVGCHDHGQLMRKSSEVSITVTLDDVNDSPPRFHSRNISATVTENATPDTVVIQLPYQDLDTGVRANTFSFADADNSSYRSFFKLDPSTGLVTTTNVIIDREKTPQFNIQVKVSDKDNALFYDTATLTITVLDQNDNDPVLMSNTDFYVKETARQKHDRVNLRDIVQIGQLHAHDADAGENGRVTFSLANPHIMGKNWLLSQDGLLKAIVTVKNRLDREEQDQLYVPILVSDRGSPISRTSTYTLTVYLEDINDNKPIFITPAESTETAGYSSKSIPKENLELLDGTEPGSVVYQVRAHDLDLHENGQINYELRNTAIFSGSQWISTPRLNKTVSLDSDYFSIDSTSGELIVKKKLSYLDKSLPKKLTILATDSGDPPLESIAFLYIRVLSSDDAAAAAVMPSNRANSKSDLLHSISDVEARDGSAVTWSTELIVGLGIGLILLMVGCILILTIVYFMH
ncbi:hypothetical protein Ciccas_011111, partial [Cichlidogyrus casuarinus]